MTQRFFFLKKWLKESNPFFNVIFFSKKKSKNWTLFKKMTQRIELFFLFDSKNWTFFECNSKSWIFWAWLEERNLFFIKKNDSKNWNFLSMTQRIDFFLGWLKELNFWVFVKKNDSKELSFSQKYDTKNWTSFIWLKDFFQYDPKNWTLLYNMTQRLFSPSKNLTFEDSQTWTFVKYFFKKKMTQRIDPFFFHCDSQNGIFFWSTNTTHRTVFFSIRLTELNFFENDFFGTLNFFWIRLKELKFSNTTQRIQLFFSDMTQSIELFLYDSLNWTFFQEIWLDSSNWTSFYEPLFQDDSKSWSLSFWLKELNLSCFPMWLKELKCFFSKCLKELNLPFMWTFLYMTQRT